MKRSRLLGLLVALLLVPALSHATRVTATLDRDRVALGDTVTLNLRAEGMDTADAPDLSPLIPDFVVLGSSSNTSVSIVNGRRSEQVTVGVALRPRRVGQFTIPSLAWAGGRTSPLQLEVRPPSASADANGGKDVFIEASAEPDSVFVGQQLRLTVRLYFAGQLSSGSLDDPQLPGVEARRLGDDLDYDTERGGRSYHVIERRYALIVQHAGRIELPALGFQGELIDPNDPDSFFGMGTPVTAASPPVTVQVRPVPVDWGNSAWLPAQSLTLTLQGLPADGRVRVGQPLNLVMTVQATGLPFEALPAPSLPTLDGATVYPDKPATGTRSDGQWLIGRRQQSFAVVPERPGTLDIPAIALKWWNLQDGRAETARIPAHTLTVLPAAGTRSPAAGGGAPVAGTASTAGAATPTPMVHTTPARRVWPWWLAFAWLLLAVVAVLAWWWRRRRRGSAPAPDDSRRALRAAFLEAARGNDVAEQARRLLAWARAERPGLPHLGALAAALASSRQQDAIAELQRCRYGEGAGSQPLDLAGAFVGGFVWRTPEQGEPSALPPLYPFKLR